MRNCQETPIKKPSDLQNMSLNDDTLRDMERHFGCKIEPYLSGDDRYVYDCEIEEQFKVEEIKYSTNSESEAPDDPDWTIEKFIFYEDFLKKLQILNIAYTCTMSKELLEVC